MDSALADFRIENDSVVPLSFTNDRSYRVNPRDLEQHLSVQDLTKVRRALRLRKQFMRSVLPSTAPPTKALPITSRLLPPGL